MDLVLNQLVERLKKAYGEGLVSVVLYGSAAAGEHQPKFSDLNVLCVLKEISRRELGASEEVFGWWRERGNPSPLLLTEPEIASSTDCFPMEFTDIRRHHRVLFGKDVASVLEVDGRFYRAQVERELRAMLLRLRQKAAGMISDPDLLRRLLADSISTFCVLFRHALALHGRDVPPARREVIRAAVDHFGIDPAPFEKLLDLRERRVKPRDVEPVALVTAYLRGIALIIDAVDRLEKQEIA
ncbi:MAG: nucleotidyltransferase domain-containing protein [Acidobacteriia bacterium]|nr:nucleotidyltransferase domain-containing protein [Terriglobia bacterium]